MDGKLHSLTENSEKVYLKSASYTSCVVLHLLLVPVSLNLCEQKGKLEFARTILDVIYIKQEKKWGTPQLIFSLLDI